MELPSPTLRRPSDRAELYAWHADALDALEQGRKETLKELRAVAPELAPPVYEGEPCCGWYKVRLHRDGVFGDDMVDPVETWPLLLSRPIPASEYAYLVAVRGWAKSSAPDQPQAAESRPIDWLTVKIPAVPPAPPKSRKRSR